MIDMKSYGCAAVILTAVEVETVAMRRMFDGWKECVIEGDEQKYYETTFIRDGSEHRLITCQQSSMGMTASTMLAAKAVFTFRPNYLILSGIAAGIGDNARQIYGDVIVPDTIWDYTTGKFVGADDAEIRFGDVGFLPRPSRVATDPELIGLIRSLEGREDNEWTVHIGPMACGSSVVANKEVVEKQVKSLIPHTVGLDMESYSVIHVAQHISEPRPRALVVKSICDYADSAKSDQYQKFAAHTSSEYVRYLLEKHLPLEQGYI